MSQLAAEVLSALRERGLKLALAESLTGGLLASELVSVAGASRVLLGSIVAYQDELKAQLLGVPLELLHSRGAVSAAVAEAMASGVRQVMAQSAGLSTDVVLGLGVTGVAGPGAQDEHAPGTVFCAVSGPAGNSVQEYRFAGDRNSVRTASVEACLGLINRQL